MTNLLFIQLCHDFGLRYVGEMVNASSPCTVIVVSNCNHEFRVLEWDSAKNYGREAHAEASMMVSDAIFFLNCLLISYFS